MAQPLSLENLTQWEKCNVFGFLVLCAKCSVDTREPLLEEMRCESGAFRHFSTTEIRFGGGMVGDEVEHQRDASC